MEFKKALEALKSGYKIKLPSWKGHWEKEGDTIKMYCKDGRVLDIRESEDVFYTLSNIISDEWEIMENPSDDLNITTVRFGEALRLLKQGKRVRRKSWDENIIVVYQKGYPDGIPCNKQTADAWGMKEGEPFICNPYLQISMPDKSHAMWSPSVDDCFAEDWIIL